MCGKGWDNVSSRRTEAAGCCRKNLYVAIREPWLLILNPPVCDLGQVFSPLCALVYSSMKVYEENKVLGGKTALSVYEISMHSPTFLSHIAVLLGSIDIDYQ